jgi:hypothetical protein
VRHSSALTRLKIIKRNLFSQFIRIFILKRKKGKIILLSLAHVSRMVEKLGTTSIEYFCISRETLLSKASMSQTQFRFIEFGVFEGALAKHFLRFNKMKIESWHGFDTFTGLPTDWGDLPAGTFSTGGQVPKVNDKNLHWHVGTIEESKNEIIRVAKQVPLAKFIIFDLDLYAPSKNAWNYIEDELKSGDIIYFDEAYYYDERNLIAEILSNNKIRIKIIGFTLFGVAYLIV